MPVFQFTAVDAKHEDQYERGTVVARDETEARQKLKRLNLEGIRFKKLRGLAGFLKAFRADVR